MFIRGLSSQIASQIVGPLPGAFRPLSNTLRPDTQQQAMALLAKHCNMPFLESIVQSGERSIAPRDPAYPPSKAGLLAIAAYTSGRLDQKIRQLYLRTPEPPCAIGESACPQEIRALETLIKRTIPLIQKTPCREVRRNMTLDARTLDQLKTGRALEFDRVCSVTQGDRQVFSIGNADLVLQLETGIVDVSSLSTFSNDKYRNEKEGMIDPGTRFALVRSTPGSEHAQRHTFASTPFPTVTVLLRESVAEGHEIQ